jgi:predicted dehydrogenase
MTARRREFLAAAGTAFTTSIFTGNLRGANDRIAVAFIGTGVMGTGDLALAMAEPGVEAVAVCDCYQPNLEKAAAAAGGRARAVKDFRQILADRSVDAVCIATPDHWHAYMTIEACKAGKDVYVEKPVAATVVEARMMVEAARKYNCVVQAGTGRRSLDHVRKACEIVRSGELGPVPYVHVWNLMPEPPEGIGRTPDGEPPAGLDWDMWLGPAPKRPFNQNRFGVDPERWSTFRYFWDYAGGQLTDNGVHVIDIMHMAMNEPTPRVITAAGGKYYSKDDRETPDTMQVTLEYADFVASYDFRFCNGQSMITSGFAPANGLTFHGEKATLYLDYGGYELIPEATPPPAVSLRSRGAAKPPDPPVRVKGGTAAVSHWANFLDCIRTRQKPIADIEWVARSTTACLLGNAALRGRTRIDWDEKTGTALQKEARPFLTREYRAPWRIRV